MKEDCELLREFAHERSQAAFAELVRRHLPRVYAVARRRVGGDGALAEEVAQTVFSGLARKAGQLAKRPSIAGWLFVSTRYAAADAVRQERRRGRLLERAQAMTAPGSGSGVAVDWESLRPLLDEAVHRLKPADREAVLLRFYEDCSYAQVATKLRVGENAARMRVERALGRLHQSLLRLGVTSSAAALATALSAQTAAVGLPGGLAASIAGAAAAQASGSSVLAALQFMSLNKAALVAGTLAVALAGAGIYQTRANHRSERTLQDLLGGNADLSELRAEQGSLLARKAALQAAPAADRGALAALPGGETTARRLPAKIAHNLSEAIVLGGPVYEGGQVDQLPQAIDQTRPTYPAKAKQDKTNGKAVISFVVTTDGGVVDAQVTEASDPAFGEAAQEAVSQWLFLPGTMAKRPVNTHLAVPIVFTFNSK